MHRFGCEFEMKKIDVNRIPRDCFASFCADRRTHAGLRGSIIRLHQASQMKVLSDHIKRNGDE